MRALGLIAGGLALWPGLCLGGGQPVAPSAGAAGLPEIPGAGGLVLKLVLSLVAVIGLILILQRLARRWGGGFSRGPGGGESLRVLSTRALAPRMSLALIQAMDRTLLVSISPQGIRPVADLGQAREAGSAPLPPASALGNRGRAAGRPAAAAGSFWSRLLSRSASSSSVVSGPSAAESAEGPAASGAPAQEAPAPGPFEGELSRRLAELRRRYQTVGEAQTRLQEGRP